LRLRIITQGLYGRILKGVKLAYLPVIQASLQSLLNNQTAWMLGIANPPTLIARADQAIE
jgi:hypothetical protein